MRHILQLSIAIGILGVSAACSSKTKSQDPGTGSGGESGSTSYCVYEGKTYPIGADIKFETWFADFNDNGDGVEYVEWCDCAEGGKVICGEDSDADQVCSYYGESYEEGENFNSKVNCNTCECNGYDYIECTEYDCDCSPKTEPWRIYKLQTVSECAERMDCPTGASYFLNACGCGCEQSTDCPETYDCSSGSVGSGGESATTCPTTEQQLNCPLTKVLR